MILSIYEECDGKTSKWWSIWSPPVAFAENYLLERRQNPCFLWLLILSYCHKSLLDIRLVIFKIWGGRGQIDPTTASDKVLPDKAFNYAKIPKYDWYQCGLSWCISFSIKSLLVVVLKMKLC